jgi:hypothetical protein
MVNDSWKLVGSFRPNAAIRRFDVPTAGSGVQRSFGTATLLWLVGLNVHLTGNRCKSAVQQWLPGVQQGIATSSKSHEVPEPRKLFIPCLCVGICKLFFVRIFSPL